MCYRDLLDQFQNSSLYPQSGHWEISEHLTNIVYSETENAEHYDCRRFIQYLSPNYDQRNPKLLSVYLSVKDLEIDRKTVGKPAKILRKIIGGLSDQAYESFAVWYKDNVELALDGMVIKSGGTSQDFEKVYSMTQAKASDPKLGEYRKSLAASCMRADYLDRAGNLGRLPHHPAYVYGSGDFEIVWIENSKQELLARVVVCTRKGRYSAAPIYTNSCIAADMLDEYIAKKKEDCEQPNKGTWVNARVLKIEVDDGEYLAPYFDQYSNVVDFNCTEGLGRCFRISEKGCDHSFETTTGSVGGHEYQCENCGDGIDEYDAHHHNDSLYCEHCFNENFFYCDHCNEYEPSEQYNEVIGASPACDHCVDHCDIVRTNCNSLAVLDETIYCETDDCYFLVDDMGDTWFYSDIDSECYSIEDLADLPIDKQMTHEQAKETGFFNIEFIPSKPANYDRTLPPLGWGLVDGNFKPSKYIYTLKDYLELDDDGEVINNQLSLLEVA